MSVALPSIHESWVQRPTEIRITLGEFCIASVRFRAAIPAAFDWRSPCPIRDDEIQTQFGSGVQTVFFPSWLTSGHLPRFSFRRYGLRYVPSHFARHYIILAGTFQEYLSGFS